MKGYLLSKNSEKFGVAAAWWRVLASGRVATVIRDLVGKMKDFNSITKGRVGGYFKVGE